MLEKRGEFGDDRGIRCRIRVAGQHKAEIKDEFIARIRGRGQTNRVAENAVARVNEGDGKRAECLARNDCRGNGRKVDQWL